MKDIIAAQQIQRRSRPSLLSTAQKYKAYNASAPVLPGNSFIADQHLPKRKKKRLLEQLRKGTSILSGLGGVCRASFKRQTRGNSHTVCQPLAQNKTVLNQQLSKKKNPVDFIRAAGDFFVRMPKNIFLALFICLSLGCFALLVNYIPPPEPPEDAIIREQGARAAGMVGGEGDSIPLDLTEVFAWQSYTVRSGDSVEAIARRFGLSLDAVIAANNLRNARYLRAGDKIRIPNMDGIPYTVKNGDAYTKIAASMGVPLEAILDANDIQNDTVNAGAVLFIPGAKMDRNALRQALGELFIWPISGRISSGFGWRNDPFSGARSFHAGLDIVGPTGMAVKVTADGRVSAVGYNAVYGNFIIVTHSTEYQTMYAHLSKILVKKGAYVNQGAVIGQVGNTGQSTGSHLHFSVYKNERAISPLEVLNK